MGTPPFTKDETGRPNEALHDLVMKELQAHDMDSPRFRAVVIGIVEVVLRNPEEWQGYEG